MTGKVSTFQAAGDALAISRGNEPDRARDRIKMAKAINRIDGETADEYWAFREYIFSGPRRDFKLPAELLNRSIGWIKDRSKKFRWEERALAYDEALGNIAALAHADESERMARRHARSGRIMQAKGMQLVRNIDVSPTNPHKLSEITGLMRAGVDVERKALGVENKTEDKVVIIATFQEAANVKRQEALPDPQDAGRDDTVIEMSELAGGAFAPVKAEGDEGSALPEGRARTQPEPTDDQGDAKAGRDEKEF